MTSIVYKPSPTPYIPVGPSHGLNVNSPSGHSTSARRPCLRTAATTTALSFILLIASVLLSLEPEPAGSPFL